MKILRKGSQSSKIIKIKPFVGLFGGSNKLIDVYNVKLNSIFFEIEFLNIIVLKCLIFHTTVAVKHFYG